MEATEFGDTPSLVNHNDVTSIDATSDDIIAASKGKERSSTGQAAKEKEKSEEKSKKQDKKKKKEADKLIKEARIAAVNGAAAKMFFMQSATHCTSCEELTCQLERKERHINELKKEKKEWVVDKEDLLSSIDAKKRVIDTLNEKIESMKNSEVQVYNNYILYVFTYSTYLFTGSIYI